MKFIPTSPEVAILEIIKSVNEYLNRGSVLLLVSGGSNIPLAVKVCDQLDLSNSLTLGLIDERYGPEGHTDSNWSQLIAAGLNTDNINTLPVIIGDAPLKNMSEGYLKRLQHATNSNDYVVGIFGMGKDGHTSGILPGSPAIDSSYIVTHFIGNDFARITTTPAYMRHINKAFLVSYGAEKHGQLARLKDALPVSEQPAQALKQIEDLTIFTDYEKIT